MIFLFALIAVASCHIYDYPINDTHSVLYESHFQIQCDCVKPIQKKYQCEVGSLIYLDMAQKITSKNDNTYADYVFVPYTTAIPRRDPVQMIPFVDTTVLDHCSILYQTSMKYRPRLEPVCYDIIDKNLCLWNNPVHGLTMTRVLDGNDYLCYVRYSNGKVVAVPKTYGYHRRCPNINLNRIPQIENHIVPIEKPAYYYLNQSIYLEKIPPNYKCQCSSLRRGICKYQQETIFMSRGIDIGYQGLPVVFVNSNPIRSYGHRKNYYYYMWG